MTDKILRRVVSGYTYAGDTDLRVMCCPVCGVSYAIPATLQRNAHERRGRQIVWFCPNGHELGYDGPSAIEQERDRLKADLRVQRQHAGRLAAERDQTAARLRAQKGATTKAKRRHAAALCPCCNRSFVQLRRHMASQHPDYDPGGAP